MLLMLIGGILRKWGYKVKKLQKLLLLRQVIGAERDKQLSLLVELNDKLNVCEKLGLKENVAILDSDIASRKSTLILINEIMEDTNKAIGDCE